MFEPRLECAKFEILDLDYDLSDGMITTTMPGCVHFTLVYQTREESYTAQTQQSFILSTVSELTGERVFSRASALVVAAIVFQSSGQEQQ